MFGSISGGSLVVRGGSVTARILVVDDERATREGLRRALRLEGYQVELAADGEEALACQRRQESDLIVLDVLMPRLDGLEACRRLRAIGDTTPVLVLTARVEVGDRVEGLDAGADDYLTKPFALDELLARVRALLRRRGAPDRREVLRYNDVVLDTSTLEVFRGERRLELTRMEFQLLELFLRYPRRALTRSVIFERVWGFDFGSSSNALDVYIGYLRRKLEADGETRLIQTIRGVGYAMREA
jgi:two-component system, OmpR family, response regulator MprA